MEGQSSEYESLEDQLSYQKSNFDVNLHLKGCFHIALSIFYSLL